jgi:hypothetical protein
MKFQLTLLRGLVVLVMSGSQARAQFINVAPQQGLVFSTTTQPFGIGSSAFDFDQDGWDDLTFARENDSLLILKNMNGNLQPIPSPLFMSGTTRAVLWVDHDNDGDMDVLTTTEGGVCRLYRNNGEFIFTDITAGAGFNLLPSNTYGVSFGDYDKDGYLDLYVCNYTGIAEPWELHKTNQLYRNNGNGTFSNVTIQAGVGNGFQESFQSMWLDVNMDGWPDIFVINDRYLSQNALFINNGDGTFTDMAEHTGTALPYQDPMSISVADMDNDGDLDIFISNTGAQNLSKLLVNNGNGTFTENAAAHGLAIDAWGWAAVWLDITNNSHQDLFLVTGQPNNDVDPNYMMGNLGDGAFADASSLMIGPNNAHGGSAVLCDINNDGKADIAVSNMAPAPPYLWQNISASENHIKVTLQGTVSNRMAVGSWIKVCAGGECRIKYSVCGENYLGQNSQHLIFGIAGNQVVDSVVVTYLSGHTDSYTNLPANTHQYFTEGETFTASISPSDPPYLCAGASIVLDGGDHSSWLWNNGATGRYLTVEQPGTYQVTVLNEQGISATSSPVTISSPSEPEVSSVVNGVSCHGGSDGAVELIAPEMTNIVWSTGATGQLLSNSSAGTFTYEYTAFGCTGLGMVTIPEPDPLVITVQTEPATMGNNGMIDAQISGGTAPYVIMLDSVVVQLPVDQLMPGTYILQVTDANNCTALMEVEVGTSTGHAAMGASISVLHPNPTTGVFFISGEPGNGWMRIEDMQGRTVDELTGPLSHPMDLGHLMPGVYMVSWGTLDHPHRRSQRLIKAP